MKKALTILSIGAFMATVLHADVNVAGSADASNPKYLGDTSIKTSDVLIWKGTNSGSDANYPGEAYLYVNDNTSFQAQQIKVSGTYGDNSNMNIILGNGSTLNLISDKSWTSEIGALDFNTNYSIAMKFYAAEGATASINTTCLNFSGANALNKVASTGAKRDIYFGEGLNVTNTGILKVSGTAEGGTFTIASNFNNASDATFTGANVVVAKTGNVEVAGKTILGGNVVIDGTYNAKNEINVSAGGGNVTVNGTLKSDAWLTGQDANPLTLLVNNGGSLLIQNKLALYSGSSFTAKNGATVQSGQFAVNTGATATFESGSNALMSGDISVGTDNTTVVGGALVIEEGANVTTAGKVVVYEGASMTINGTFTSQKGEFLLTTDDNGDSVSIQAPTFTLGSNAVLNVNAFRSRSASVTFTSGSKTTVDASSYLPDQRGPFILAGMNNKIEQGASVEIKAYDGKPAGKLYANLVVDGTLKVSGGTFFAVTAQGLYLNSSDITFTNTHLALGDNGDLGAGKVYIQKDVDLSGSAILVNKLTSQSATNGLTLSDNVTFKAAGLGFYQQDAENRLVINLGTGSKLILEDLIYIGELGGYGYGTLDSQDSIVINNFAENAIAIKNYNSTIDNAVLERIEVEGINNLYWIKGQDGYYWLSATAVPEPAEWAAIFGAVALGLAIYRRRK